MLSVRAKQGAQGGCPGRAKHVCPGVPKVSRPKKIAASYHGTTQHDADPSDGIPRRAVRRCTTWDSISVRCGIKRGEGTVPKKIAPRGETAVSTAVRGSPGGRNTRVQGSFSDPATLLVRGLVCIRKQPVGLCSTCNQSWLRLMASMAWRDLPPTLRLMD